MRAGSTGARDDGRWGGRVEETSTTALRPANRWYLKYFCVAKESLGGVRTWDENGIYKRKRSWGQRFAQEKRPSLARLRSYHCTDPNRDSCGGWGPALGATHETFCRAARLFLQREAGPRQRRDIVMMVQPWSSNHGS